MSQYGSFNASLIEQIRRRRAAMAGGAKPRSPNSEIDYSDPINLGRNGGSARSAVAQQRQPATTAAATSLDPNEVDAYLRDELMRKRILARAAAGRANVRIGSAMSPEARVDAITARRLADHEDSLLAQEATNLRRLTTTPMTEERREAGRMRLREQFPAAIAGVREQTIGEQSRLVGNLMRSGSDPYARFTIPRMTQRYGELENELAGLDAAESRGLKFSPNVDRPISAGVEAMRDRYIREQLARKADTEAGYSVMDAARTTGVNTALAGSAASGYALSEASRRLAEENRKLQSQAATGGMRTAGEYAGAGADVQEAQNRLTLAQATGSQESIEAQRQAIIARARAQAANENVGAVESEMKLAAAEGKPALPTETTAPRIGSFLADTIEALGTGFIDPENALPFTSPDMEGEPINSIGAITTAENYVTQLEQAAKRNPEQAKPIAALYLKMMNERSPEGIAEFDSPSIMEGLVEGWPQMLGGSVPTSKTGLKKARRLKHRLRSVYDRVTKIAAG